jgi:type IV secretory pathway VirB4 component
MAQPKAQSAQAFVPIKEIRSGTVVLKDNSLRAVLIVSSLNFALKSEDEQSAIILEFQNMLNAIEFPIQIFIESRQLDIRPYIALLENQIKEQAIELIRIQTREYIDFIKKFTEDVNIMSKRFFVIVPYTGAVISAGKGGLKGTLQGLVSKKKRDDAETRLSVFEESRSQLEQRLAVVSQNLARAGVRAVQLQTEELVELYYKLFNPGDSDKPISLQSVAGAA